MGVALLGGAHHPQPSVSAAKRLQSINRAAK
jgi:hypothetical protein